MCCWWLVEGATLHIKRGMSMRSKSVEVNVRGKFVSAEILRIVIWNNRSDLDFGRSRISTFWRWCQRLRFSADLETAFCGWAPVPETLCWDVCTGFSWNNTMTDGGWFAAMKRISGNKATQSASGGQPNWSLWPNKLNQYYFTSCHMCSSKTER